MTTTTERPVQAAAAPQRTGLLPTEGGPQERPAGASHLSNEQVATLGRELDAIRDEVLAQRGESDAKYIRNMIRLHRSLELAGRITLIAGRSKWTWFAGVGAISVAKILENMEIGHNVLHGQWDWMRDPDIHSTTWEWDFVAPSRGWQHTHNDIHHTWTNVVGKDRDVGYNILRVTDEQPWNRRDVFNPLVNLILAPFFEWGIASYDLKLDMLKAGVKTREEFDADVKALKKKAARQVLKDYIATPVASALIGRNGWRTLAGTFAANTTRNIWAHAVIFCGHFPDGVDNFSEDVLEGETRGDWYVRQMLGSANISGSKLMHIMTGNLSHQIEHHAFPDLPSNRYIEVAPKMRDVCERYELSYNTGPLYKQYFSSWKKICQLSLPDKVEGESRFTTLKKAWRSKPAPRG